ncbi:MAG: hypothetical protein HRU50_03315 [Winogradskyella sp.]|uniref:tetratricopeptide repeat protein n=1 Tax=Winogradskyella sp. TaxID=1883156 RepID=UPI0025D20B32|nr:hypothetical protein [Winogradskyella sp.]NRB58954.1 hypothetical protein [Winogradskyella sp.]
MILSFNTNLNAHGDLHERILRATEEIAIHPDSASLYIKRGKLYYQHQKYENSLFDFQTSQKLGLDNDVVNFYLAKNHFQLSNFELSKKIMLRMLKSNNEDINYQKLLAQVYKKLGNYKKSAKAFEKVILHSNKVLPENFIDASNAWFLTKTKKGIERSQNILIQGIEKLGNVIVLYDLLVSNAIEIKDYSTALKYQEKTIDISHRKERAYLKLADIYIKQKTYKNALLAISEAEFHYKKLPHRIRNTKFMREFYSELRVKKTEITKL